MSTKSVNVLVVDDESAISEMIRFALKRAGMNVRIAADAREALVCISEQKPDIILMDWMMPGVSGVELTRRLRRDPVTSEIPVIMLTAKVTEDDKVTGLNAGSDDYIVKPFSPRELVARIQAVLRRSSAADDDGLIRVGKLTMNTLTRVACGNNVEIRLGPTEYRLLEFFMTHPGRSYSRSQLLDHVWGTGVYLEERTVDVHIKRLRKAMDVAGLRQYVQTVRGHGYRLMAVD